MRNHKIIIGLLGLVFGVSQMPIDFSIRDAETPAIGSATKREGGRNPGHIFVYFQDKRDGMTIDDGNVLVLDAVQQEDVCKMRTGKYPRRKRVSPYHWESYVAKIDDEGVAINKWTGGVQ
jgi:hypothetical protein